MRVCYSHSTACYPKHSTRSATRHQYLLALFGRNNKIPKRRQTTGKHGPVSHTSSLLEFHFARILDSPLYLAQKKNFCRYLDKLYERLKNSQVNISRNKDDQIASKGPNRLRESEEVMRTHNPRVVYIIMVMVVYGNSGSPPSLQGPN